MAFLLDKKILKDDMEVLIKNSLNIAPKIKFSKFNRGGNKPTPVEFYIDLGEQISIPFLYASSLLKIRPNRELTYPKVDIKFCGNLRENQKVVENEALEQLGKYGTTTLGLYPGYGKTILGAKLASKYQYLTIVLVHREILTIQWKKTFTDFTSSKIWIVGERNPPDVCDVIICMNTRWETIPIEMRKKVGFMIVDEAHAFCTPSSVGCLLSFYPKYVVIESATLERENDAMERMIYAIAGTHGIFRENDKEFMVMKINTGIKTQRKTTRMGEVNWPALVNDTLFNKNRNNLIINLVMENLGYKILILTSLVDHAQYLNDCLVGLGVTSDFMCGNRKNYTDGNVLVGTLSKLGTGFDQDSFCPQYDGRRFNLLILVCSIKNRALLVQNIGRCFRSDYPTIMHLVDDDDIFKSHWYKCRTWYIKHKGKVTDVNIFEEEEKPTVSERQKAWLKKQFSTSQ